MRGWPGSVKPVSVMTVSKFPGAKGLRLQGLYLIALCFAWYGLWWFMMAYDGLWWFMMVYDDGLWWFMLVFDDLWYFIIAFSMMTATTYVTNNTCNKCLFIVSDSSSINILALPCYGFFSPAFIVEPTPDRVTNKPYSPIVSYSLVIEYMSSPITSVLSPVFSCFLLMFDVTNDHQKKTLHWPRLAVPDAETGDSVPTMAHIPAPT